jgi:hypothetical protein
MDWLKNFDVQRWWKAAIVVGLAIVLGALAVKDHGIALVGLGVVGCGFGEWMNHRMETQFLNGGTLTSFHRFNRPMGLALDGVGIILVALGLYRVIAT